MRNIERPKPVVRYIGEVNKSTPYIITVNQDRLGDLFHEKFGIKEDSLSKILVTVTDAYNPDALADANTRPNLLNFSPTSRINLYGGTIWTRLPESPYFSTFLEDKKRWELTKKSIIRIIFHEAQHIQDLRMNAHNTSKALVNLTHSMVHGSAEKLLWNNPQALKSIKDLSVPPSNLQLARDLFKLVREGVTLLQLEKRAERRAETADVNSWLDLIDFKPNSKPKK